MSRGCAARKGDELAVTNEARPRLWSCAHIHKTWKDLALPVEPGEVPEAIVLDHGLQFPRRA